MRTEFNVELQNNYMKTKYLFISVSLLSLYYLYFTVVWFGGLYQMHTLLVKAAIPPLYEQMFV